MVEFTGIERITFDLGGTIDEAAARRLTGATAPLANAGLVAVSLLFIQMRGLRPSGLPLPGIDYGEVLWRLAVEHEGAPAWLAVACDLDRLVVRRLGAWLMRYPVRRARIAIADRGREVDFAVAAAGARLDVQVQGAADGAPPQGAPSSARAPVPLLVYGAGRQYRIPWGEAEGEAGGEAGGEKGGPFWCAAPCAVGASTLAEATLGTEVRWAGQGVLHRGRRHRCGIARPL